MSQHVNIAPQAESANPVQQNLDADSTRHMMIETLETGLSQSGKGVRIRELQREPCQFVSSFQGEHVRVLVDSGEWVSMFFKDMNPNHQVKTAQKVRGNSLGPSYHELRVYQEILSRADFGTARLYAVRWEPHKGIFWIFLEDVGNSRLRDCRNFQHWVPAARWAARFHATARKLAPCHTSFLPVWNAEHYRRCAERVRAVLPELNVRERAFVGRALEHYISQIDWFAALPRTVIHGQFFGKNIMLRAGRGDRILAVIDWETAALGPGSFDLASLSSGKWTHAQRYSMRRAYFDEYRAQSGVSLGWDAFFRELKEMDIYQGLEWIGWWRHRSVSHNFGKWLKELARIMSDYSRDRSQESMRTRGKSR